MTSAQRYPPPQPPPQNDFRLPSLKDLNFYRPSGSQPVLPPSQQQDQPNVQPDLPPQPARHLANWNRSAYQQHQPPSSAAHQQYSSPTHEVPPKVEYTPKHETNGYAHPAVHLSVQQSSVSSMPPPRNEDSSHSPNQLKRQRIAPSRDSRPSNPSVYSHPQYSSYPQPPSANSYPPVPNNLPPTPSHATHPAPSSHDQIHHHSHPMPVTTHQGYGYPTYVQPRQTLLHSNSQHHSNPYSSSAPPPTHAPPPQDPWAQSHSQQPPTQFQQPPPPPPPPSHHPQHTPHPVHASPHHHHPHHPPQPSMPAPSNPPVATHHHHQQPHPPPPPPPSAPPMNPPPSQHNPPPVQYHPQPQQYQNHYPHTSQQPQQHSQQAPASFVRPTAINPSSLENRSTYTVAEPPGVPSVQNDAMSEITDHCNILYSFSNQYVSLQQSNRRAQPPPAELEEMSRRALKVVRLLNDFRRIYIPDTSQMQTSPSSSALAVNSTAPMQTDSPEQSEFRAPKRPWEDTQEDEASSGDGGGFQEFPANPSPDPKSQSTAEQDMELIRSKRATSTAIANNSSGQPKSKYRKRSMGQRASPPGKCHSCNIRETPEWRRGPDGARTLCNACGLHYAKLMRKQNKAAGNGDPPHIDLETLRASTRAADMAEKGRSTKQAESSSSSSKNKNQQNGGDTNAEASNSRRHSSPPQPQPPPAPQQGTFQLVNMMAPPQDHSSQNHNHGRPTISSTPSSTTATPMQVDSRPASQRASTTPQMQAMHQPPPLSSAPLHHSQSHTQPHLPWPTTAATTGPAAAASGAVSGSSASASATSASNNNALPPPPLRVGPPGSSTNNGPSTSSFGNPPTQSPVEFMRRQYSIPNGSRSSGHQPASR